MQNIVHQHFFNHIFFTFPGTSEGTWYDKLTLKQCEGGKILCSFVICSCFFILNIVLFFILSFF